MIRLCLWNDHQRLFVGLVWILRTKGLYLVLRDAINCQQGPELLVLSLYSALHFLGGFYILNHDIDLLSQLSTVLALSCPRYHGESSTVLVVPNG